MTKVEARPLEWGWHHYSLLHQLRQSQNQQVKMHSDPQHQASQRQATAVYSAASRPQHLNQHQHPQTPARAHEGVSEELLKEMPGRVWAQRAGRRVSCRGRK